MERLRNHVWMRAVVTLAIAVAAVNAPFSPAGAQEPEIDVPDPDAFIPPGPPRANPQVPPDDARCGLDIAVVLDLSNSVDDTELAQFKEAARGFITALEGTASAVGIYNFATFAPANASAANAPLVFQEVSSAVGATAARSKITGLTRPTNATGGTNWDRGLAQVTESGQRYDAVLFLTDGDPTAYGVPPDQPPGNDDFGTGVDEVDVQAAIDSANALKDALTRIIAVGIGTGASPGSVARLQAISGPTENVDYFLGDFDVLAELLAEFARGICNATIAVNKLGRSAATGTTSPRAGWTFTSAGEDVTPPSATTLAAGNVEFIAAFTDTSQPARPVTITETVQPGYVLEPQLNGANAACVDEDSEPVTVTNVGVTGFTLDVAALDNITCTVINREQAPPLLTLVKEVVNDDGGAALPSAWTLSATGPSTISGATGTSAVTDAPVPAGTYTLAEAGGPAGYAASDWVCDGGTLEGATLTLALDDDVTCTITNDDIAPTLTLIKELEQDPASPTLPTGWTLGAAGPSPITGITGDPAVTSAPVDAGAYTLSEEGPAGFDLTGWACTGAPLAGQVVTIPLAADVTCTATNRAIPSWTLVKTSTPPSGSVVARGSDITYTLTVTNASNTTVTGVVVTDDLSDVLDDAALDTGSISADAGTAGLTGTDLVWTLPPLPALASVNVSYTVTVDDDAFAAALRNVATGDGDVPPISCAPGQHRVLDHPRDP